MILIDRLKESQSIILTLDGIEPLDTLGLIHDATREHFFIPLGNNVSPSPERFDLFRVDTSVFSGMPDGYYSYAVLDYSDNIIESGKLFIKPIPSEQIPAAETHGNYLVFTNN